MKKTPRSKSRPSRFKTFSTHRFFDPSFAEPSPIQFPSELDRWLLRSGAAPESNLGMNQIGIYTDFN